MTDEMLALAQRNAAEAGATNVEFLKGHIEAIPLPAESVDVVISNCVINLAADKPRRVPRDRTGAKAGWPHRDHGHRGRGRLTPTERPSAARTPVASRAPCRRGVPGRARGRRADGSLADADPRGRRRHGQRDRQGDEAGRRQPLIDLDAPRGLPIAEVGCCGGGGCC